MSKPVNRPEWIRIEASDESTFIRASSIVMVSMNDDTPDIILVWINGCEAEFTFTFRNADLTSTAFKRIMRELGYSSEDSAVEYRPG
jgi:hypothetical protein